MDMKLQVWRILVFMLVAASTSCSGKGGDEERPPTDTAATVNAPAIAVADDKDRAWRQEWREDAFAGSDFKTRWQQFSRAAQAELSKPGADPSDIMARASELNNDPQKIFEFVRDRVALEPYAGLLRGARGTLVSGSGNALDRALLAQELLASAGFESRLVAGTLPDAQVNLLLTRFLAGPLPDVVAGLNQAAGEAEIEAQAAKLAAMTGVDEGAASSLLQQAVVRGQQFWAATDAQRQKSFAYLSERLKQGNVKMAIDRAALTTMLRERLRKHYWLQLKEPDGAWSHFDTAMPDASRGAAFGTGPTPLAEIPKEVFHQLEFSLVYQTLMDGAVKEDVLVSGTFASADALFEPLEFRIQPGDLSVDADALATMDIKTQIGILKGVKKFQGILRSGKRVSASRYFDLEGNLYNEAGPILPVSGGTLVDAFGGGGESTPQFLELRVVMRMTGPGRQPMSQVRTLVRSRNTQSPTFAPPILEWELLMQPQWISAEFVGHRTLGQLVAMGSAFENAPAGQPLAAMELPPSAPVLPLQVAQLRQVAAAGILADKDGIQAFIDEPLLMISGYMLGSMQEAEGLITAERGIDIVENAIRYVPRNDASQSAAYEAALRQSAADSAIEDRFLRVAFPGFDTQSGTVIFNRGVTAERPALLARVQDIDAMRSAGVTEPDIEWIYDNEHSADRLLISTTGDGLDAWWSIRPDGNAILRANGGRGSAMVEYAINTVKVGFAAWCLIEFGSADQTARDRSGGIWSESDATNVAVCLIATGAAGAFYGLGLLHHGFHFLSLALIGFEIGWNYAHFTSH